MTDVRCELKDCAERSLAGYCSKGKIRLVCGVGLSLHCDGYRTVYE